MLRGSVLGYKNRQRWYRVSKVDLQVLVETQQTGGRWGRVGKGPLTLVPTDNVGQTLARLSCQ